MDRTRTGRFSKQAQKNIQRSGAIASGLLDLIPFVGAGRSAMEGDYGSAAMQGLLDVAPVGKAVGLAAAPLMGAIKNIPVDLPPLSNAQKTQIIGTLPTYQKAADLLNQNAPTGKTLDFGAGLGEGAKVLKADTFEPYPRAGFSPTYTDSSSIPSESYERLTNFNVLNVVPKKVRDSIVMDIGRILKPGGTAIVTTRGKDVLNSSGAAGPEPMSVITSIGTYQKGFTPKELQEYIGGLLGDAFEVSKTKLGPAGVVIKKKGTE